MPARVFISYAHADEIYRDQLDKQLSTLKRAGIVEIWHDRRLVAGEEWDQETRKGEPSASLGADSARSGRVNWRQFPSLR